MQSIYVWLFMVLQDEPQEEPQDKKNQNNINWINVDGQAHIDTPTITFANKEKTEEHQTKITKVKMWCNPASLMLEPYELKMNICENSQP